MPSHFLLEALIGLGPVLLFLAALVYMDSFKLVSFVELLGVMGLGVVAAALSYPASGAVMDYFHADVTTYSHYMAPFVEEGFKAAMLIWLFSRNRIGFMVDAAILGAAVGGGFALAENVYYAYVFPDANIATWMIRGLGTAVMHSGTAAIFAIATETLREKRAGLGLISAIPGFLFAVSLHAIFNQFLDFPFASTAGILIVLPLMLMTAIDKSEHEVHDWMIHDYESHEHLLADIKNGVFAHSEAGRFILSLVTRFSRRTVADIFAYLKLHTELVLCAEKLLLARERGQVVHACRADAEQFARLHALEKKIGRTALAAVWPHLKFSRQELFELHALEHEAAHAAGLSGPASAIAPASSLRHADKKSGGTHMLTKADDYPVHQLPEPIATSGTDRNFYDRYFFNGYTLDGSVFFALALGVYPHLNVMDAAFSVIVDGVQHNLRASRLLKSERMDTQVGPIAVSVIEPLQRLKITVSDNPHGIAAEIVFNARAKPVEEPRFTFRQGPRTFMDYTRLTQNGAYEGFIDVQGKRIEIDSKVVGTRDRSWGVRPIGLSDPQPPAPLKAPQFYWLWSPLNFSDLFMLYHINADETGKPWNTASVIGGLGDAEPMHMASCKAEIDYKSGTRHARRCVIETVDAKGGAWRAEITPRYNFYMSGIGYMHPEWGHGQYKGESALSYDSVETASVDEKVPLFWHVQAFSSVKLSGPGGIERNGAGVLEQLVIGAHAPSGFTGLMDTAP